MFGSRKAWVPSSCAGFCLGKRTLWSSCTSFSGDSSAGRGPVVEHPLSSSFPLIGASDDKLTCTACMHGVLRIFQLIYFHLLTWRLVPRYFICLKSRQVCNLEKCMSLFILYSTKATIYMRTYCIFPRKNCYFHIIVFVFVTIIH